MMHFNPLSKTERADWRELMTAADPVRLAVVAILFLFSALVLPLSHVNTVSALYLLCAAAFYYALTRSVSALFPVAIPVMLLYGLTAFTAKNPLALPAAFVAVLFGAVCGAFLIANLRGWKRWLASITLPLLAYAAALLVTRDPFLSLLVLIPAVLASVLAYCLLICKPLTPTVLLVAATVLLVAVAAWMIWLWRTGWPDANPLVDLADRLREGLLSYYERMLALYEAEGMPIDISVDDLRHEIAAIGNILPGGTLALCLVFAFGMWRILLRLLATFKTLPHIPVRLSGLTVSAVAAALFILSYFVAIVSGGEGSSLTSAICLNIALALEPPLILVGFSSLIGKGQARSCLSLLLVLGLFLLFMSSPASGLAIAAFVGAFHILLAKFLPSRNKGES